MRISDWSSDVCSSDLAQAGRPGFRWALRRVQGKLLSVARLCKAAFTFQGGAEYLLWKIERHSGVSIALTPWQRRHPLLASTVLFRSEEHTSELQSLMRISYAVFCLKKKKQPKECTKT